MNNVLRIGITLASFVLAAYGLYGVDFARFMRKGSEQRGMMLYLIVSMALGYLIAQFILSLSTNYII